MNEKAYPSLEEMSGESKTSPRLELNEIQFNGQKGTYILIDKIKGLVQGTDGKKKYEKHDLGGEIQVIFLRVRRKLRQFRKGENPLTTNEHNSKYDMLTLFGADGIIKGSNDDLRERFAGLKTNQIVYSLLLREGHDPELVRLVVKGASLGSEAKAKDVHDFYSYIGSFKGKGRDDHFYEYVTELSSVAEESSMGSYFAINYAEGRKLEADEMTSLVTPKMREVFDHITASDAYYQTKNVEDLNKERQAHPAEDLDVIEYPDEDVNPEDIPF